MPPRTPARLLTRRATVTTEAEAKEMIGWYLDQEAFAFDVESVGPHRGTGALAQVTWLSMATHGRTDVLALGHPNGELVAKAHSRREKFFDPDVLTEKTGVPKTQYRSVKVPARWTPAPPQLRPSVFWEIAEPLFMSEQHYKVAHNALYDLAAVAKYLPSKPPPPYDDTMFMAMLVDENARKGLKPLVRYGNRLPTTNDRYFSGYGHDYDKENVGKRVEKHPFGKVATYSALDAMYTWWLRNDLLVLLERMSDDVMDVYAMEMDLYEHLLDMHLYGQPVDASQITEVSKVFTRDLHDAEKKVYAEAGKIFNLNSPPQMAEVLFEDRGNEPVKMTDGGNPSTDKEVLAELDDPITDLILDYREFGKLVSAYLGETNDDGSVSGGLLRFIVDGRIHTDLKPWGTKTGRFSSADPNLQNIPRRGEHAHLLRKMFVAPPGYSLVVADYSQIEYRVLAHYCKDETLLAAFFEGYDPHAAVAAQLYEKDIEDVTPDERDGGKAQPVSEPVLTPKGFVPMGDIKAGDLVIGSDGAPTEVEAVFPQGERPIYRVTFTDGSRTFADAEHLWSVRRRGVGEERTMTTADIAFAGLRDSRGQEYLWQVPLVEPVKFYTAHDLPLPPYAMGALLGDGSFRGTAPTFSSDDEPMVDRVHDEVSSRFPGIGLVWRSGYDYAFTYGSVGVHPSPFNEMLREQGLWGKYGYEKRVPEAYLHGSAAQRLDLLRGLMDTDGWASKGSGAGFSSSSRALAHDVRFLVQSLGGVATVRRKETTHRDAWVVRVNLGVCPFWVKRKADAWAPQKSRTRRIAAVEYSHDEEAQCIRVAAEDSLYVTRDFIVTHNTFNFAQIYGAGDKKLAKTLGVTVEQIKVFRKKYDTDFPRVGKFNRYVVTTARRRRPTPYIQTLAGRRRHLPALLWKDDGARSKAERQAVNSLIQGSAADIIKIAMQDVGDGLRDYPDWRMLLTVHDEIMLMAPDAEAEDCASFLQDTMESVKAIDVPLEAESAFGKSWQDAK